MTTRRRFLAYSGGTTLALYGYDRFGIKQAHAAIPGGTLDPFAVPKYVTPLLIPPVMPRAGTIAQAGGKNVDAARKRLKELILESLPFFKSNKFFFGNEMSLVDCAITPIIWRLPALGIQLPKDAKCVEDYGLRIFRNPAFMRSMTPEEKVLRDLAFS